VIVVDFTNEEAYLVLAVKSARDVQNFLWGELNKKWDLEEWKRMFRKRVAKLEDIDPNNPHAVIELKKRLLQTAALSIAFLNIIDQQGIKSQCEVPSNLPEYKVSLIP
jgi:hypothetical protein